jgi:hypothetical protein
MPFAREAMVRRDAESDLGRRKLGWFWDKGETE